MDATERRSAAVEFLTGNNDGNADEVVETPETQEEEVEELEDDERGPDEQDEEEEVEESEEGDDDESEEESDEPEEGEGDEEESEEDGSDEEEPEEAAEVPEEVQERADAFGMIEQALDATDYPLVGATVDENMQELGLRLTDASHLYAIVDGREVDGKDAVTALFERVAKFQGQEVADSVLSKILEYAKAKGLIEGGDDDTLTDPVAEENKRLKAQLAARNNPVQQQISEQQKQIFNSAEAELKRLSDDAGIGEKTFKNVLLPALGRYVGGQKAIINRIARGNFVDITRFFADVKNELVARQVKSTNRKVENRKSRDRKVPKTNAGGDKPRKTAETRDLSSREGRMAAAKSYLR